MKKLLFRSVIFILLVYSADLLIGNGLQILFNNTMHRETAKIRYTLDSTDQDILIFGSSRAQQHYIPDTITNYTGMSSYNCGIGGQGIQFSYLQIHETLKRYNPKIIILDIWPNLMNVKIFDKTINKLLPFIEKDSVFKNTLTQGSCIEKTKMISKIYPYNSTIYNILSSFYFYRKDSTNGFITVPGSIDTNNLAESPHRSKKNQTLPDIQTKYLNFIIDECKLLKFRIRN